MSKTMDNLEAWLKKFRSGKIWLTKLRSEATKEVWLPLFKLYCDVAQKTPDELIELKMEDMRLVGTDKEFQAEELYDITISEMKIPNSRKANLSESVKSFYRANRRPLVEVKKFERPSARKRTPKLEDIEDMASCSRTRRDEALVWFLTTSPFREGTLTQLKWKDLKETNDSTLPYMLNIEAERLKGHGKGKYKDLRQICFVNYFVAQKLMNYRKEAERKGVKITPDTPLFIVYRGENGNGNEAHTLSDDSIRLIFQNMCLDAWNDLNIKRFSPHDFRRFVNTAMERAKISDNWRSIIMGHVPSEVKGKFYSDPAIKELMEHFKSTLAYLIPEYKQTAPKKPMYQPLLEEAFRYYEMLRNGMQSEIKTLEALIQKTTNPELKQLLEVQITTKKERLALLKPLPRPDWSRIDEPLT
jgi:integrase